MLKNTCLTIIFLFISISKIFSQQDSVNFAIESLIAEQVTESENNIISERLDSLKTGVPLVYNLQVDKYINAYLSRKTEFSNMLKKGKYLFPIFEKALYSFQIPICFKFLPVIESSMNEHAVSKSGAVGLWQFMYKTGIGYKLEINDWNDERKDPIQSSFAAARYFRDAYKELGDWLLVLAAYNCGTGAVKKAIQKAGGGNKNYWEIQPYLSKQTQNYVPAFIAATYVMSYSLLNNIVVENDELNDLKLDSIYITKKLNISKLEESLKLAKNEISDLNPSYKKGIIYASESNPKRLIIPQLQTNNYDNLYQAIHMQDEEEIVVKHNSKTNQTVETNEAKMLATETFHSNNNENVQPKLQSQISSNKIKSETQNKNSYFEYTVRMGDTLLKIANRYKGLTVDKIKEINRLTSSILKIGSTLKLASFENLAM